MEKGHLWEKGKFKNFTAYPVFVTRTLQKIRLYSGSSKGKNNRRSTLGISEIRRFDPDAETG